MVVDLLPAGLAVSLAALVATGLRTGATEAVFYGGVLLAMSLNRFLLAALSASLPHTIDAERVHGGQLGGAHGRPGRGADRGRLGRCCGWCWAGSMPDYSANAILFVVAAGRLRAECEPGAADPPTPAGAGRVGAARGRATSSPGWSRHWPICGSGGRPALGLLTIGGAPDHLRDRHRGDDPGLPQLLPHPRPGRAGDRRPRAAGGGHRRRLRLRRRGHAAGPCPARGPRAG